MALQDLGRLATNDELAVSPPVKVPKVPKLLETVNFLFRQGLKIGRTIVRQYQKRGQCSARGSFQQLADTSVQGSSIFRPAINDGKHALHRGGCHRLSQISSILQHFSLQDRTIMPAAVPSTLNIGVLFFSDVQLLDFSAIDLFAMCSKAYLRACEMPAPLVARGLDNLNVCYIAEGVPDSPPPELRTQQVGLFAAPANAKLLPTTPSLNLNIAITHSLKSPDVAPGKLDILLIPGPDPATVPNEAQLAFMRGHAAARTDLLVVCTGIFPLAHSGILEGRECTGPRPLIDMKLRKLAPGAKWRDDRRWVVDQKKASNGEGELWTSGGITNGLDMVAAYLRDRMSPELAGFVCQMADVGDRAAEYEQGKLGMGASFGWVMLRSWWAGLWGQETLKKRS